MDFFIHIGQVPAMLHRWNTQSYTVEGEVARFDQSLFSAGKSYHNKKWLDLDLDLGYLSGVGQVHHPLL